MKQMVAYQRRRKGVRRVLAGLFAVLALMLTPAGPRAQDCIDSQWLFDAEPGANQPSDLALGLGGDIYLVDGVNNRILAIDSGGRFKFAFGRAGSGPGEFNHPLGIDVAADGRIFVADSGNHRIQVFNADGGFRYAFAVVPAAGEKPSDPVDVAVSRLKGYVYVADNQNHKIKVYQQNGKFEFEWGGFGEGAGEFRYPGMLTINAFNEVFVVDVLNTRVQKFNPFGQFLAEIGTWGVLPGRLFRPKGLAVDKDNRVFVSDSYMGVVQVFSDLGRFLGVVCDTGQIRRLTTPVGLLVDDKNQRLHVVEMRRNRIRALKLRP